LLRQDERLAAVVEAWPDLPEPIRAGIAAMIETTTRTDDGSRT
jgi:N-acetylneuraminic acid mutarotase